MKARVKHNNEIIDVIQVGTKTHLYDLNNVEILDDPDYWTRLKHQYAGMAMQVLMTDPALINVYREDGKIAMKSFVEAAVDICYDFSHALVEKMKEEK